MLKRTVLGTLLILTLTRLSLAAAPTTQQVAADWLDRAQHDITTFPVYTPEDFSLVWPNIVASDLYWTAPSDDRRGLALKLLDQTAALMRRKLADEQLTQNYISQAVEHAKFGDADGARALLAQADKSTNPKPSTNPNGPMILEFNQCLRAEAELLLGDQSAVERINPIPFMEEYFIDDLTDCGHPDLAAKVKGRALKKSPSHSQNPFGSDP
jgi:hypothetical protein